ncbi:hypothetical protein [Paenibacillus sp. 1001270B_150601_E10]|uniref:hypothetical protein n=1 Tax=Paenibacillus sp. 1001270B_150601_E10 TaxID=2787079 RepID=UPI00189D0406|nr:hypothetical protein [Paenibacillus sp. 1001270B_150601_E10]
MLLKKKSTIISIAIAFILAAAACYYFAIYNSVRVINTSSMYQGFSSAQSLYANAEMVVIGSPVKDFEDREIHTTKLSTGLIGEIVTFTEIKIEKVLKGPEEDAVDLTVIEPVGVYQTFKGREKITSDGYSEMKKGSTYLIFLGKNTFGQYSVINMQDGKFNFDGTDPEDLTGSSIKKGLFTEIKERYSRDITNFNNAK